MVSLLVTCSLILCHASTVRAGADDTATNRAGAEEFVDAFYSFDPVRLRRALYFAKESIPELAFYQGWAEGGHYTIVSRTPCEARSPSEVSCSITVEDDLMKALRVNFNVTDTFHLSFAEGMIVSVRTTSNDPAIWEDAKAWVRQNRSELVRKPCEGYFNGGPTPGDCVRAMVQGLKEFAASPDFPGPR